MDYPAPSEKYRVRLRPRVKYRGLWRPVVRHVEPKLENGVPILDCGRLNMETADLCLGALGVLLLLFCSLDVWYFLRVAWAVIGAWFQKPVWDVLGEQSVPGRVLLQDIDMGHMNNARYLRECDFARFSLYSRNGVFKACRALRATLVVGATTIRLRRALFLGEAFELRTRIVVWDEKAFYLEQRFVSCRDGLVAAVMFCKQNVIRSSPEKILQYLCKRKVECPDYPEELQHWISFISASSQALRAQSGLKDTTTESSQANVEEQENAGEQEHLKDKDK
ncbi:protein THEM6 [Esox lucius]|uniref:Protein THEM6 n=1 Tax=Esox lucius TaxID=8010 RepID=A0A3P8Y7L0_ESOLU|nr:protein THEM6 [Esox lucius]